MEEEWKYMEVERSRKAKYTLPKELYPLVIALLWDERGSSGRVSLGGRGWWVDVRKMEIYGGGKEWKSNI